MADEPSKPKPSPHLEPGVFIRELRDDRTFRREYLGTFEHKGSMKLPDATWEALEEEIRRSCELHSNPEGLKLVTERFRGDSLPAGVFSRERVVKYIEQSFIDTTRKMTGSSRERPTARWLLEYVARSACFEMKRALASDPETIDRATRDMERHRHLLTAVTYHDPDELPDQMQLNDLSFFDSGWVRLEPDPGMFAIKHGLGLAPTMVQVFACKSFDKDQDAIQLGAEGALSHVSDQAVFIKGDIVRRHYDMVRIKASLPRQLLDEQIDWGKPKLSPFLEALEELE